MWQTLAKVLSRPTALTFMVVVLLGDWLSLPYTSFCSIHPRPRAGTFEPPARAIVRRSGVAHLGADSEDPDGVFYAFIRHGDVSGIWATTSRRWSVGLSGRTYDGRESSPSDLVSLGTDLAAQRDARGDDDSPNALLRAGGGQTTVAVPAGYVHNALAAVLACAIITSVPLTIRASRIQERERRRALRGLCTVCGNPIAGRAGATCPECGRTSDS